MLYLMVQLSEKKRKFKKNNVKKVHCRTKILTFIGTKFKKVGPDDTEIKSHIFKNFNALVKESVLISWMLL